MSGSENWRLSDGALRRFGPGSGALLDDVTGKGHLTQIEGDADGLAGIVQLPD